jgi:hypothetical protein
MNRTIKDATVKRYFYATHDPLRHHLPDFLDAYNFARRLKTLSGLTPDEFICKPGPQNHKDSISARSSKCRDETGTPTRCRQ